MNVRLRVGRSENVVVKGGGPFEKGVYRGTKQENEDIQTRIAVKEVPGRKGLGTPLFEKDRERE